MFPFKTKLEKNLDKINKSPELRAQYEQMIELGDEPATPENARGNSRRLSMEATVLSGLTAGGSSSLRR